MKNIQRILLIWCIRANWRAAAYGCRLWLRVQRRLFQRDMRLYRQLSRLEGKSKTADFSGQDRAG